MIMSEQEEKAWISILKKCGVYKHPNKLTNKEQYIQMLILNALFLDSDNLPNNPMLSNWFQHIWLTDKRKS